MRWRRDEMKGDGGSVLMCVFVLCMCACEEKKKERVVVCVWGGYKQIHISVLCVCNVYN